MLNLAENLVGYWVEQLVVSLDKKMASFLVERKELYWDEQSAVSTVEL